MALKIEKKYLLGSCCVHYFSVLIASMNKFTVLSMLAFPISESEANLHRLSQFLFLYDCVILVDQSVIFYIEMKKFTLRVFTTGP